MKVYVGNLKDDGVQTRGWIIGSFIPDMQSPRHQKDVEIKWGVHKKGKERTKWSENNEATTVTIVVKGKEKILYEDEEIILREGEYLICPPHKPHKWIILEDAVIVTVRWPSLP